VKRAALAWLAGTVVVLYTAWSFGYMPFHGSNWVRNDSNHYLTIAQGGYVAIPCGEGDDPPHCGNTGWFPGYPLLIRAAHLTGLSWPWAGLVVAWAAGLGALMLICRFTRSWPVLLYASLAPGVVFTRSVFPLSLALVATLGFLWHMRRERWLLAGLCGAAAVCAYPTAAALALTGLWGIRRSRGLPSLLTLAGLVPAFALERIETGHWDAYFLCQQKPLQYGPHHDLREPFARLIGSFKLDHGVMQAWQTIAVTLLFAIAVWVWSRDRDWLLLAWAVPAWLAAYSESWVAVYRTEAALMPLALVLPRLPKPVAWAFATSAVALAIPMTGFFVRSTLM